MPDRVVFPDLPDAELILQNEEHLVVKTSHADNYEPGDELLGIPRHVCPTSALHRQAWIVSDGKVTDQWDVASRDRWITI
jgi:D-serine deaminase-like pyridoxal phosphate-dependent protein